jgi:transcriptional regulator with XRE-family HTH domain
MVRTYSVWQLRVCEDDSPNPTIETVQRIAKALEVSVDDLLKK